MKKKTDSSIDSFFAKKNITAKEETNSKTKSPTRRNRKKSKDVSPSKVGKLTSAKKSLRRTKPSTSKRGGLFSFKKNNGQTTKRKLSPQKQSKKNKGAFYTFVQCSLTLLFLLIPLFFTGQTFQGINFEKSILLSVVSALLFTLVFLRIILKRKFKLLQTPFDKALPLFVLLLLISALFSVDKWHSFFGFFIDPSKGFLIVLSGVVLFYLLINFLDTAGAKRALRPLTAAGVLIAVYVFLINFLLIPKSYLQYLPYSPTGSLRSLAVLLSVMLPIFLAGILLLAQTRKKVLKVLAVALLSVATVLGLLDLLVIKNLVSWSGLFLGVILFTYLVYFKKEPKIPLHSFKDNFFSKLTLSLIVIVLLIAGLMVSQYGAYLSLQPKIKLNQEVRVGIPLTVEIAEKSLTAGYKQSLLGSGPATFSYDFAKFHPAKLVSPVRSVSYLYQGDGLLGEAIPTIGLLGGLLVIWLVVIVIKEIFINPWPEGKDAKETDFSFDKIYFAGLSSALLVWLWNAFTNRIDASNAFLGLLLVSLAFAFILRQRKERSLQIDLKKPSLSMIGLSGLLIILFVTLVAGGIYNAQRFITDVKLARIVSAGQQSDNENDEALQKLKRIIYGDQSKEGYYYLKLAEATALAVKPIPKENGEEIRKANSEKIAEAIRHAKQAEKLMPNNVETINTLADIYSRYLPQERNELKKFYRRAIELEPNTLSNYLALGDLWVADAVSTGDKKERNKLAGQAVYWYQKGLKLDPKSPILYDRLATVYYLQGDLDKAIVNTAKAILLDPKNIFYKINLAKLYQEKGGQDNLAKAEKILVALGKKYPTNVKILSELAIFYEQTNQIDKAKDIYKKIIGLLQDSEKDKALKKHFEELLQNLENGKVNFSAKGEQATTEKGDEEKKGENKEAKASSNNQEENNNQEESPSTTKEMVTISVDSEGPINVRADASLSAQKLTKIRETGRFRKIDEKGNWVQIIIPAQDGQEEIKGWVHKKFVTE